MKPAVQFECESCDWVHVVPEARIAIAVDGIPRADYVPFHECERGASILERSCFDADFRVSKPGAWMKIRL